MTPRNQDRAAPYRKADEGMVRASSRPLPGEGRIYPDPHVFSFPLLGRLRYLMTGWKARLLTGAGPFQMD